MGLIKTSERITPPDDADAWFVFRQLTRRQLDAAFEAEREKSAGWRRQVMDGLRAAGGDPALEIQKLAAKMTPEQQEAVKNVDLLSLYDACTVVDFGIASSSYGLSGPPSEALDSETVGWAAREILGMSVRSLLSWRDTDGS